MFFILSAGFHLAGSSILFGFAARSFPLLYLYLVFWTRLFLPRPQSFAAHKEFIIQVSDQISAVALTR
jgi:hypothetical protein